MPDDELPVLLPEVDDYRPKGKPPLASNEEWLNVPCPSCGGPGKREAETMDTFVDSAWYFLRYCDPHNEREPFSRRLVDFWGPVDQYIGGIDHATGHLLYSRFFVKVLNEQGMVGFREPFQRLFHQGWVRQGGTKMSKSKGNVTAPDQLADMYGADAVRLYILFVGPADQDMDWTEEGIEGIGRFLRRLWRIVHEAASGQGGSDGDAGPLVRKAHETIARVSDDIGRRFVFNTPIAAVMELVNELGRDPSAPGARFAAETAVSLIQPYAPHIAEELWSALGHERLWEQPVAGRRRVAAAARDVRAGAAGQRPRARPRRGVGRGVRGAAGRAGQGLAEGAGAPGRQGDPADDRRAGEARQPGRLAPSRFRHEGVTHA